MFGLIGGTGLDQLEGLKLNEERELDTPYGKPSGPLQIGEFAGEPVAFFARHGRAHNIPPHAINYRANIWALKEQGVDALIAVAAVGGIRANMVPGEVALPHDLIDYTWGREHSYSLSAEDALHHVEFDPPYDTELREAILASARRLNVPVQTAGVHAVTQGPRLETAAEIRRMANDGCDIVGMTGMPEAALAAELGMPYACLAVVVNWAAGLGGGTGIHAAIEEHIATGMGKALRIIGGVLAGGDEAEDESDIDSDSGENLSLDFE